MKTHILFQGCLSLSWMLVSLGSPVSARAADPRILILIPEELEKENSLTEAFHGLDFEISIGKSAETARDSANHIIVLGKSRLRNSRQKRLQTPVPYYEFYETPYKYYFRGEPDSKLLRICDGTFESNKRAYGGTDLINEWNGPHFENFPTALSLRLVELRKVSVTMQSQVKNNGLPALSLKIDNRLPFTVRCTVFGSSSNAAFQTRDYESIRVEPGSQTATIRVDAPNGGVPRLQVNSIDMLLPLNPGK